MRKHWIQITYAALAISVILTHPALSQENPKISPPDLQTLRQAAEAGDSQAQTELAHTYLTGRGIEKDYGEAIKWYRRAADLTNATAQLQLGLLYLRGDKVQRDYISALEWLKKAASLDVKQAQYLVSRIYKHGLGVQTDMRESYAYANLAATDGGAAAAYRDKLEETMSLPEISAGQERSRQLRREVKSTGSKISMPFEAGSGQTAARTLAEARARARQASSEHAGGDAGQVIFSEPRVDLSDYGEALLKTIREQWHNLTSNSSQAPRAGKIVMDFELKFDGTVTDVRIKSDEVGRASAILCERAIVDPSPYPRWPRDLFRKYGKNSHRISLTFTHRDPHTIDPEQVLSDLEREGALTVHPPGSDPDRRTQDQSYQRAKLEAEERRAALSESLQQLNTLSREPNVTAVDRPQAADAPPTYGNYALIVKRRYEVAWRMPDTRGEDYRTAEISVTVARDGKILDSRITRRSGLTVMDKSIESLLRDVKQLPPFPENARDDQRTFTIEFNLQAKKR